MTSTTRRVPTPASVSRALRLAGIERSLFLKNSSRRGVGTQCPGYIARAGRDHAVEVVWHGPGAIGGLERAAAALLAAGYEARSHPGKIVVD